MGNLKKNISLSLLANVISMLLGALAVIVLPKYLSIEQYGYYQLYLLYVGFTAMLAMGVPEGIYLALGGKRRTKISRKNTRFQLGILSCVDVLIFAGIAFFVCFSENDELRRSTLLWVVASGLINCIRNYPLFVLQATGRIKEYAASVILERVVSMVPIIVMAYVGFTEITTLLFFDVFGRFVSFVYVMFVYLRMDSDEFMGDGAAKGSFFSNMRILLSQTSSGVQLMIASYASVVIVGLVRMGVEAGWEFALFAQISLVISIANMLTRLINAVAIPVFPALRGLSSQEIKSFYGKASFAITLLFLVLNVFVQPVVDLLSWWISDYAEALQYTALLVPMCLFESKTAVLVMSLSKSLRQEKMLLVVNLISIVAIALGTAICVAMVGDVAVLLLALVFVMGLRCAAGEAFLRKKFLLDSGGMVMWDIAISCAGCFVWYFYPSLIFACAVAVLALFVVMEREKMRILWRRVAGRL